MARAAMNPLIYWTQSSCNESSYNSSRSRSRSRSCDGAFSTPRILDQSRLSSSSPTIRSSSSSIALTKCILVLLLLTPFVTFASAQSSFTPESSSTCASPTSFFDTTSLTCSSCATDQVATGNLTVPCICAPGFAAPLTSPNACVSCGAAPSWRDRTACTTCTDGATYDATSKDCVCPSNKFALVEYTTAGTRLPSKQCMACPANAIVLSTNLYACVACSDPLMTRDVVTNVCACPAGYTVSNGACLLTTYVTAIQTDYSAANWPFITYHNVKSTDTASARTVTVRSRAIDDYFLKSAVRCRYEASRQDCQTLANLCVLAGLSPQHEVCRFYRAAVSALAAAGDAHGFTDWNLGMPWLYYSSAEEATTARGISTTVRLQGGNTANRSSQEHLRFVLYAYTLNGTFIGTQDLDNQLQLCPRDPAFRTTYLNFGSNFQSACNINSTSFITPARVTGTVFYEMYFVDVDDKLFPVPVKVLNLRSGGVNVNSNGAGGKETFTSNNVYVRRFFVTDVSGGVEPLATLPTIVTWARSITLRTSMQGESTSSIYPPVVVIDYTSREYASVSSTAVSSSSPALTTVTFTAEYEKDLTGADTAALAVFSLGIVLVLLVWILKICAWQRSERSSVVGIGTCGRVLMMVLGPLGEIVFWVMFAFSAYVFLFFKAQMAVYVLLPTDRSIIHTQFPALMYLVWFTLLFSLIQRIYSQLSVDIIFIDWEARKPVVHPDLERQNAQRGVSAWRKIFVVNKWLDLQTARGLNLPFVLFFLVLLLAGAGLEGLATAQPDGTNLSLMQAPMDPVLRFFIASLLFLGIAGVQRLFRFLILDRFVPAKSTQFVDLLNATNISACIFDHKHHMFYLHGKTVHSHADASLEEIRQQVLAERRDWVQSRGLIGGNCTFSVFLTPELRAHYDTEYGALLNRHITQWGQLDRGGAIGGGARGGAGVGVEMKGVGLHTDMAALVDDELVRAHGSLNRFLMDFFDRNHPFHKWEYYPRGFVAERMDMPPAVARQIQNTSLVCADTRTAFTRTLLLGIEHHLLIFYVATYCMFNLWFQNSFVCAFAVYIFDRVIVSIRERWGRINTSAKTLIDQRFLV